MVVYDWLDWDPDRQGASAAVGELAAHPGQYGVRGVNGDCREAFVPGTQAVKGEWELADLAGQRHELSPIAVAAFGVLRRSDRLRGDTQPEEAALGWTSRLPLDLQERRRRGRRWLESGVRRSGQRRQGARHRQTEPGAAPRAAQGSHRRAKLSTFAAMCHR